jgi:hypothetical protein
MKQLQGKIFWVNHDFNFYGIQKVITSQEVYYTATKVTNFVMDENMISFYTSPYTYQGDEYEYKVNLLAGKKEGTYTGSANYVDGGKINGRISCIALENKWQIMLYGEWHEDEIAHTFWAIIDKTKSD